MTVHAKQKRMSLAEPCLACLLATADRVMRGKSTGNPAKLESVLRRTPYRAFYVRTDVNNFYPLGSRVIVNATVRLEIDTCIVGDDSTCKAEENESCRTVFGVSSCYCRPGYARKKHREPCKTVSSLLISLKVDRMESRKLSWNFALNDPDSEEYQRLEYESEHALESVLRRTPYRAFYVRTDVNNFYPLGSRVIVNATVHFNECLDPKTNDCDEHAECENTFGAFSCKCKPGYVDKDPSNKARAGRKCQTCSPAFCNNRGDCVVKNGAQVCQCRGSYFGERCEMDGEVVGVAVGASVAAVIIIVLTLVFLCLWSRKWKREQAKSDYAHTFTFVNPGLSGLAVLSQRLGVSGHGPGATGKGGHPPPYRMNPMDADRLHPGYHPDPTNALIPGLAQNVYAQPEPLMPKRSHTPTSLYASTNVAMHGHQNAVYHQQAASISNNKPHQGA
ncbi:unnamed protein product [Notodromas monacha]|uniref:Uncharacterized protein n=1 Tax=Notodromas monacha TaxID=399045 RepID=A0A7R9BVN3_9CRUS|nr:unnamed protein product [Notodromas monacha]CAG0921445.1 unnamed protein product [Notodromas monacha]